MKYETIGMIFRGNFLGEGLEISIRARTLLTSWSPREGATLCRLQMVTHCILKLFYFTETIHFLNKFNCFEIKILKIENIVENGETVNYRLHFKMVSLIPSASANTLNFKADIEKG